MLTDSSEIFYKKNVFETNFLYFSLGFPNYMTGPHPDQYLGKHTDR